MVLFSIYIFQMIRLASAAFIIYLVTIHKGQPKSIPNANAPTPSSTQTTTPSSVTTTRSKLCLYGGDYYPPNTNLSTGSSMVDNWCHGVIIDKDCNVMLWDNFNCFPSTTTATTTPTIPPPFSLCPHNGQELNPGEIIPTDDQWCSGVTCTIDGLQIWHYYNCTTDPSTDTTTRTTHEYITENPNKRRTSKKFDRKNIMKKPETIRKIKLMKALKKKKMMNK